MLRGGRRSVYLRHATVDDRRGLCGADVPQETGVRHDRRRHAGAWHRRDVGHLQRGGRGAPDAAAVSGARAPRARLAGHAQPQRLRLPLAARGLPRLPRAGDLVRGDCRADDGPAGDRGRRRPGRGRAPSHRRGDAEPLPRARHQDRQGIGLRRRRRHAGARPGRRARRRGSGRAGERSAAADDPQLRVLATAVRRRPRHRRSGRAPGRIGRSR